LAENFGVVVIDENGRIIDYSVPTTMPYSLLKEAVSLSYDIYRTVKVITKELGYSIPKNMTIKLDSYEVTIFKRYNRIVIVIIYEEAIKGSVKAVREAVVES